MHAQLQAAALVGGLGAYRDAPARELGLQPVADGVFHQRLQQQRWHAGLGQRRGQVERVAQARAHAHGHEGEVVVQPRELIGQGVAFAARGAERGAQVVDQTVQHVPGPLRVGGDERAQIGQRVEQHVRLQLCLQQLEPGLGSGALRLRHVQLQLLRLGLRVEEVRQDGARGQGEQQHGLPAAALPQRVRGAAVGVAQGGAQHEAGHAAREHQQHAARAGRPALGAAHLDHQPRGQADGQGVGPLHVPCALAGERQRQCDEAAENRRTQAAAQEGRKVGGRHGARLRGGRRCGPHCAAGLAGGHGAGSGGWIAEAWGALCLPASPPNSALRRNAPPRRRMPPWRRGRWVGADNRSLFRCEERAWISFCCSRPPSWAWSRV